MSGAEAGGPPGETGDARVGMAGGAPSSASARRPSRRAKLLAALLGPVLFFGLLEAGLRIGGYRFEPWSAYQAEAAYDEWQQGDLYVLDPDLLWTLRPSAHLLNQERCFPGIDTNAAGLRAPELPGPKAPGELRVLCLGDSITFGLGLLEGQPWPDRCAAALREMLPGRPVTVVNAGVPGWSSVQGMRILRRLEAEGLDPDVVVYWFGMNDAKEARDFADRDQRLPGAGRARALDLLRRSRVFQLVQHAVAGARRTLGPGPRVSPEEFSANVRELVERERSGGPRVLFVRSPERLETTAAQLEEVLRRADEVGAESVVGPFRSVMWIVPAAPGADLEGRPETLSGARVLLLDGPPGDRWSRPVEQIRRDLAMLRAMKVGLDRALERLPPGSPGAEDLFGGAPPERVFFDNCHLSIEGAERAGRALAEILRRRLQEPR